MSTLHFPRLSRSLALALAAALAALPLGCEEETVDDAAVDEEVEMPGMAEEEPDLAAEPDTATEPAVYIAQLRAVNPDLTGPIVGTATITVTGDEVTFIVDAAGVPAGMMHLQHTHGLSNGEAACPGPDADANGDGVIDLVEAEASTGTTMIPFHDNPTNLQIKVMTYPEADDDGRLTYEHTVSLDKLRQTFQEQFPGQQFAWDERVVMIHGVPEAENLPETAQSLPDVPAHVTLPIACGPLELQGAD